MYFLPSLLYNISAYTNSCLSLHVLSSYFPLFLHICLFWQIVALVCSSVLKKAIKDASSAPPYLLLSSHTISHILPDPALYPAPTVTVPMAEEA